MARASGKTRTRGSCSAKREAGAVTVSLPVLKNAHTGQGSWAGGGGTVKKSRAARWRLGVLITVHVIILVHVAQWLITGMTLSPVEPSESMQTLREGVVNTGFVLFSLALLSTLIFGRFFCGWGCHVIALQDASSWILKKFGIRPRPFRSRLMLLAPLGAALFMFVWPVAHRLVVAPLLSDERGRLPTWLGQSVRPEAMSSEFLVTDFWSTFPQWYVAIPFLLICGFGAVYFLGAKGYCTYGCPYGGFFAPIDKVSVGRIVVDHDKCEGCGHCTAVCTSNVRVHEEIRDFGMVMDPGCMKCMDCVSVCPNDALSFSFARPAVGKKPINDKAAERVRKKAANPRAWDMTWPQDLVVGLVFLVMLLGFHQFLNQVPFLMALGMAGIGAYAFWLLWSMLRKPNVRLHNFQLRLKGRIRPAGVVIGLLATLYVAAGAWGLVVRSTLWDARWTHEGVQVPLGVTLRPEYAPAPDDAARAEHALDAFRRAGPVTDGGYGWIQSPDALIRQSYLRLVLGDPAGAESMLREVLERGSPRNELVASLEQVMTRRGATQAEVLAMYEDALRQHPDLLTPRARVADARIDQGRWEEGRDLWDDAVRRYPHDPNVELGAARFHARINDRERALELARRAVEDAHARPGTRTDGAQLLASLGQREEAIGVVRDVIDANAKRPSVLMTGARGAVSLGEPELATRAMQRAAERDPDSVPTLTGVGSFLVRTDRVDRGLDMLARAGERLAGSPWELHDLGAAIATPQPGLDPRVLQRGLDLLAQASASEPASPVLAIDHAGALFDAGRTDEALGAMASILERWPGNAGARGRYALMLLDAGRIDEALAQAARFAGAADGATGAFADAATGAPIGRVLGQAGVAMRDPRLVERAEAILTRCLVLENASEQARIATADLLLSTGRVDRAIDLLAAPIDSVVPPSRRATLVRVLLQAGRAERARDESAALLEGPLSLGAFNDAGAALIGVGRQSGDVRTMEAGVRLLDEAASHAPPGLSADLLLNLAIGAISVGQNDRAVEAIERAAALNPADAEIAGAAATILERAGDAERAAYWRGVAQRLGSGG